MPYEDDIVVAEVDADPIENNNPIEDLLRSIESQDYTGAEEHFNDIIGDRLQSTLDQAKIRIADQIFNAQQDVDDDIEDETIDLDLELDLDDEDQDIDEDS